MDIWLAIVLVSFGLIFLVLEVFVFPGVGISGVLGIISLGIGVYIAFQLDTYLGLFTLASSLLGTSILVYFSIKFDTFSMMSLKTNIDSIVEVNHLSELKISDTGISISRLSPMGKAQFNDFYSEVSSQEGFIEENSPIIITNIKDNTIFVSPIKK
jgi:membrane-bound ClpP family serine protease